MDELAALQQAIQMLHDLMTQLSDPNATNVVGKCLAALTNLQNQMMSQQGQGAQAGGGAQQGGGDQQAMIQAMAQRLQQGGAAPAGY